MKLSPRWREPAVPPREALLLLPRLPARAWTPRPASRWVDALEGLGMTVQHAPVPVALSDLVVVDSAGRALRTRAHLVLLDGRDRTGRLRRAGYEVRTYVAQRGTAGAVRLAPLSASGPPRTYPPPRTARERLRHWVVAAVRRCSGRSYVTIAHHGPVTPAAVAAAVGSAPGAVLLSGGGGARRRSTFLVRESDGLPSPAVVKVAPPAGRARGRREQQLLRRLLDLDELGRAVPRPLGEGPLGPLCWSAESALPGQPLPDVLRRLGAAQGRALLDDLAGWFADLGVATRTAPETWDARESTLPLRGEHVRLARWRLELSGVPGVLVHGDVGTGGNVLVEHGALGIIDWETARWVELPLTDLLPLLGLALASARPAADRAGYVLRLCAGEERESGWLLGQVRSYCSRVGVPLTQAGRLAALAWGYQASMRLVHEELVTAAGEAPSRWTSPAEEIARAWDTHPALGPAWSALTSGGCG